MAALSQSQLLERLNVWKLQYLIWQEPFNSWSLKALTGAPLCWCLLVKSCLLRSQSPGVKVHEVMFAVEVGGCGPRRNYRKDLFPVCVHYTLNWIDCTLWRSAGLWPPRKRCSCTCWPAWIRLPFSLSFPYLLLGFSRWKFKAGFQIVLDRRCCKHK